VKKTTIWVPHPARQFIEEGVVKCACPECGNIKEMAGFDEVIAYACNEFGAGVDVLSATAERRVKGSCGGTDHRSSTRWG
jgi:hypothetical protein